MPPKQKPDHLSYTAIRRIFVMRQTMGSSSSRKETIVFLVPGLELSRGIITQAVRKANEIAVRVGSFRSRDSPLALSVGSELKFPDVGFGPVGKQIVDLGFEQLAFYLPVLR